jgi:hypothetical protein
MSFIDDVISSKRIILVDNSPDGAKSKITKTSDNQKTDVRRVEKFKIREVCMQDATSFNMLNLYTNMIMKAGYKYVGRDAKRYTNLFEKMMLHGDKSSIRRLKKEIIGDRAKYGAGFVEIIPYEDKDGNEFGVADLRRINASRIDYVRDKQLNIIFNKERMPYGFVMNFGVGAKGIPEGDKIPTGLSNLGFQLKPGQIYLKKERVAVFPLFRLDNGYNYLGLIEPAYQDIVDRLEAMKIQINAIKIKATSLPIVTVGDSTHEPTPQLMDDAESIIASLKEATGIALPYNMKMDTVKFEALDILKDSIKLLLSSSSTAAGVPLALLSGNGEETNRSTLKEQIQSMIATLQSQVEDFVEDWNIQIIDRIQEANGFGKDCELVWNGIRYEDDEEEKKTILEFARMGVLHSSELRKWLRAKNIIDLDDDEEFEKKFGIFINYPNKFHNIYLNNSNVDTTIDNKKPKVTDTSEDKSTEDITTYE